MKKKFEAKDLEITWIDLGKGVWQYNAFKSGWMAPVGIVWVFGLGERVKGKLVRGTAMVINSYVPEAFRRQGVRTILNQAILQHYRRITSESGSSRDGVAFMKANGYRLYKELAMYVKFAPKRKTL